MKQKKNYLLFWKKVEINKIWLIYYPAVSDLKFVFRATFKRNIFEKLTPLFGNAFFSASEENSFPKPDWY